MYTLLTTGNITFGIGMIAILFSVYSYFRNPQINSEKKESLLSQQVLWEKDSSEKRFSEMGTRIESAMTLAQNHIHTVDTKVEALTGVIGKMGMEITRLSTIIDERIPKKLI